MAKPTAQRPSSGKIEKVTIELKPEASRKAKPKMQGDVAAVA